MDRPNPSKMAEDPNYLARIMLEWYDMQNIANEYKELIEEAVIKRGETFDVGTIRCSFYNPADVFETWEYAAENKGLSIETIAKHTSLVERIDYKAYCEELGITRKRVDVKPARAVLKLKE